MKIEQLIVCSVTLLSLPAFGEEPLFYSREAKGDPHICSLKASVFESAATARDNNGTPALARQMTAAYKEIPADFREAAIKRVYEDPRFSQSGRVLYQRVLNACLYPNAK